MTNPGSIQKIWRWCTAALAISIIGGAALAAPVITVQPVSPLVAIGMPQATLSVTATGQGELRYQWLRNGAEVSGATGASLVLAPLDHTTRGVYHVRVTDDDGSTLSRMTRLGHAAGELLLWDGIGDLDITYGAISQLAKGSGPVGYQVFPSGRVQGTAATPSVSPGTRVQRWSYLMVGPGAWAYWWTPSNLEPVVALASVHNKAYAVETDGDVVGWAGSSGGGGAANGTVSMLPVPADLSPCLDISMNAQEVVAVKADGTLAQWAVSTAAGAAPVGVPPPGVSNVIAVSSSPTHHLALKRDGTVLAWGTNAHGECDIPVGLSGVVEIAAGHGFSLALKQDGTLTAWGDNTNGQITIPAGLADVLTIYASTYCMATRTNGAAVAWGLGAPSVPYFVTSAISPGQVTSAYNGSYPAVVEPFRVPMVTQAPVSVVTRPGYSVTLEAKASGYPTPAVRWQKNGADVPNATSTKLVLRNISAAELGSYRAVFTSSVGESITAAAIVSLLDEPVITSHPVEQNVLLGAPAQFSLSVEAPASNPASPISIQWLKNGFIIPGATQAGFSIAAVSLADVGDYQAVINGTFNDAGSLKLAPGAQRTQVARLRIKGEPIAWGREGYSSEWLSNYGTQIPGTINAADTVEIAASELSFLIRDASGTLKQWNVLGQSPDYTVPQQPAATISSGYGRFISIDAAGVVKEWFADVSRANPTNSYGYYYSTPIAAKVVQPRSFYREAADGPIEPWFHASGAPAVKVSSGAYHNLALLEDGSISAWASQLATSKPDYYGSVSSGRTHQQSTVPEGFMAGRTAAAVAAGAFHNLVLFSDGTVGAWGKNDAGQSTVPAGLANVVRIVAHGDTSIAIKADGQIVSWGRLSNSTPTLDRPSSTPVTPMQPFRRRNTHFSISGNGTPSGTQISLDGPGAARLGYTSSIYTTSGATLTLNSGASTLTGLIKLGDNITLNTSLLTNNPVTTIQGGVLTISSATTSLNSPTINSSLAGIITSGSTLTLGSGGLVLTDTNTQLGTITTTTGSTLLLNSGSTQVGTDPQGTATLVVNPAINGSLITSATGLYKAGSTSTLNLGGITTVSSATFLNLGITNSSLVAVSSGSLALNTSTVVLGSGGSLSQSLLGSATATPSPLIINSGNLTISTATLSAGATPSITLGAGATLTIDGVTHAGPLTLQRQSDGTYLAVTVSLTQATSSSQTSATTITSVATNTVATNTIATTSGATLNLSTGTDWTSFETLPLLSLGGLSWDPSLFTFGGGMFPSEPYTSHDSSPLALPAVSAEIGTTFLLCDLGGIMLAPGGLLASWGQLPSPPADLADIVDVAANQYGVIALRAYTAPRIVLQPLSQEIFPGYTGAVFRAQATGFPSPAIQWQKGTESVSGQTQATFTLAQASTQDAGSYRLSASNAYGTATSDAAVLSVITPDLFTTWKDQNFAPASVTAGLSAPNADPGGHGVPNLLRYALGLDPARPDATELPRLAFGRHPLLPANVGGLFFCVPENVSDVVFRLGVSTNLGSWKVLDVDPVLGPVVNGKRQVWLPCPPDEQDVRKTFYKLIVEPAAPSSTPKF